MALRQLACVGDPLQHGGRVLPPGAGTNGMGPGPQVAHAFALMGGLAHCERCKSDGVIVKSGGPKRPRAQQEIALDGDLVACKCSQPPRIVATLAQGVMAEDA
ncbi:PAAR domain-containing protein [Roseateles sp. BYS180W]|uniref:PAAR domain-containing protein n=1 Tax=Roseateles rivi TaxID=3299028 RepID=A0ABW7FZU2_9BURK